MLSKHDASCNAIKFHVAASGEKRKARLDLRRQFLARTAK